MRPAIDSLLSLAGAPWPEALVAGASKIYTATASIATVENVITSGAG